MELTDQEINVCVLSIYRDEQNRRAGNAPSPIPFGVPLPHMKYGFIPYRPARTVVVPNAVTSIAPATVLPLNEAQRVIFEADDDV